MKYRFYGDELQLIRYELFVTENIGEKEQTAIYSAASVEEKDELLNRYPDATVKIIDNSGYEWLDGEIFTQEQIRAGAVEQAIAMGEEAYTEMKNAPTQEQINAMLMLEIAKMKAGVVK